MKKLTKVLALAICLLMLGSVVVACQSDNDKEVTYQVLDETLDSEQYAIGFRNGDLALGLEVQKIMDEMIKDGTSAKISAKWFNGENIVLEDGDYLEEAEAPADDVSLQKILDKGTFVLGFDSSFPPMGFIDENNEYVGFDIDLAKEVTKRMGVELVLQPINWDAKELELTSGRIDCIWNGMTVNEERLASMFMAKPYLANDQIVIVPEGSEIKTLSDLKGKKVGLQKGSSSYDAFQKNAVSKEINELVELENNVDVFLELKTGRIDAFVVDEVAGYYIIANN